MLKTFLYLTRNYLRKIMLMGLFLRCVIINYFENHALNCLFLENKLIRYLIVHIINK